MLGTTLFGLYFACRYSLREQMHLLVLSLGIAAILTLSVAILVPSLGITGGEANVGSWRGIYAQKNVLGRMMGMSAVLSFAIATTESRHRHRYWLLFALSVSLIILARSVTPLISLLTVLLLISLYRFLRNRWPPKLLIPAILTMTLIGASSAAIVVTNLETFFGALGKDLTLTGRTKLWFTVMEIGNESAFHRWFGYGYNGFWLDGQGDSARVWSVITWMPDHAHNGLLDIWLDLGLIGATLFVIVTFVAFTRSVFRLGHADAAEKIWPFLFLTYFIVLNSTQGIIMRPNNLFWVLFLSIVWTLSPLRKRIRIRFRGSRLTSPDAFVPHS